MGAGSGGGAGGPIWQRGNPGQAAVGTTSYQTFIFGLALLLVATAIVWTGRITRPIGVIMGLQGITYLVVGWDVGAEGLALSEPLGVAYYLGSALLFIWMVWLLIVAWRMRKSVPASSG